jgi:hypothetical protein
MIEKLMKKKAEVPTIVEVYDSMHRVFGYFDERFDQIDRRFEGVEGRLSTIAHDMREVKVTLTDLREEVLKVA